MNNIAINCADKVVIDHFTFLLCILIFFIFLYSHLPL